MKLIILAVATVTLTSVPPPKPPKLENAYVRIDAYNTERLISIGQLPSSPSPYLLSVYIWDNRLSQYVRRQVYADNGITEFTGSPTYPIIIPRAGEEDGVEIP